MSVELIGRLVLDLRRSGVEVYAKNGQVHGHHLDGRGLSFQERAIAEQLRDMNADAVAWLQAEQVGRAPVELRGVTIEYGLAIGRAIKAGKAELIGKVRVHMRSGVMDVTYRPLEDFDPDDYLEEVQP